MSDQIDESIKTDNTSPCGPNCNCGSPSSNSKVKILIGIILLLAASGILLSKIFKAEQSPAGKNTTSTFAVTDTNQNSVPKSDIQATTPYKEKENTEEKKADKNNSTIGENLSSLSELNKVAMNQDAVFIYIPSKKDEIIKNEIKDSIINAENTLKSKGIKIGLYTLQTISSDYSNISKQVSLPAILVASKGRGMGAVSGEITETKLLQAFVSSSRAGGCCPSGDSNSSGCK